MSNIINFFDAHCHFFNIKYPLKEIGCMIFRCCRYKSLYFYEEKGLFDFFGDISDFLKWFYDVLYAASNSEEDNFNLLRTEIYDFWQKNMADYGEVNIIASPLMMDVQYMFDSTIPSFTEKRLPLSKGIDDLMNYDEVFLTKKYNEIIDNFLEYVNSKRPKDISDDNFEVLINIIEEERYEFLNDLQMAKGVEPICMSSGFQYHYENIVNLKMKYPTKIFPFLAVDPRRPGIISEILKGNLVGKGKPFTGIKLYPRLGYMPNCQDLYSLYDYCEKTDIPITTHSSQGGFPTTGWKYHDYCNPKHYDTVLSDFPNLRINFAHFGYHYEMYNEEYDYLWSDVIVYLMTKYQNVYTDISCYTEFDEIKNVKQKYWNEFEVIKERMFFGTDFDVMQLTSIMTIGEYLKNFIKKDAFTKDELITLASTNAEKFLNITPQVMKEYESITVTPQKGICLVIGMNEVDPNHYDGWSGRLSCCEKDASDISQIALNNGFTINSLYSKNATRKNVQDIISNAAKQLSSNDIFMIYYSGHGGQVEDINNDEEDKKDETWCLYDGQMLDDELNQLWTQFKPRTRILLISDSCHSGTINKEIEFQAAQPETKIMPFDLISSVYDKNKTFYDTLLNNKINRKEREKSVRASIILLAACQDNQVAMAGYKNSFFTSKLISVWEGGNFKGDYRDFLKQILKLHPASQTPNYLTLGMKNNLYESQKPFTI